MQKIFLIRHGVTEQNKQRRYCGISDICLSELGRRQAKILGQILSEEPITSIYTSPLKRCLETSNAISGAHGICPEPLTGLSEIDFGLWEGLTFDEIQARYPEQLNNWVKYPDSFSFPQGQCIADFRTRVLSSLGEILKGKENSLVVAHGGSLRVIICHLCGCPMSCLHSFELEPASLTILEYYENSAVVRVLNETCHLKYEGQSDG